MMRQAGSRRFHSLIYLGAGAELPLEACAATADRVWLVEASVSQAASLERAAAALSNVQVDLAVVDREPGSVTFQEYNLPWASGIRAPDESLRRLYPGLRCLHSEVRQSIGINSLVEKCLENARPDADVGEALLVIDLGTQAEDLLAALSEGGNLGRFTCIAVVPPRRQPLTLLPPHELHGPLPLPEDLAWLGEASGCFVAHPLLERAQGLTREVEQLAQKLAALEASGRELAEEISARTEERDSLREQLVARTRERDDHLRQCEAALSESEELRLKVEARTQERGELWD